MLEQDVKPDRPAYSHEEQDRPPFIGMAKSKNLDKPSDRFIKVAEALHSASKTLGLFGN
jgi:hypothetical protein